MSMPIMFIDYNYYLESL